MKKIIVINAFFLISCVQSADINQNYLQETLPPDLQLQIILLSKEGNTFDEFIPKLKDKRLVNTYWRQLLDDPTTINALLENTSKQWNTSKSAIAYALGTPGAQEWLKNNNISLEQIFAESTTDDHLRSDFPTSKYFTELASKLWQSLPEKILDFVRKNGPNFYMGESFEALRTLAILITANINTINTLPENWSPYLNEMISILDDLRFQFYKGGIFKANLLSAIRFLRKIRDLYLFSSNIKINQLPIDFCCIAIKKSKIPAATEAL